MDRESKRSRTEKTLKQKVVFAKIKINRLTSMEKAEQKRVETGLKVILGEEVAMAMNSGVEQEGEELFI